MQSMRVRFAWYLFVGLIGMTGSNLFAQTVGPKADELAKSRQRAVNFLKTTQFNDGSWTSPTQPGISGLVTFALLQSGVPTSDPVAEKALQHFESFIQPDGGIYAPKSRHANYETSIAILALSAANQQGKYTDVLKKAEQYIRKLQWDENELTDKSDVKYGGAGYGTSGDRPDLSNTTFFMDALKATGATPDDPAMQKALVFLSRCQNLESEYNTTVFSSKINDGGFYYTPAAGGNSMAGKNDDGGLRSYASMTYAGLKSMLYAGLTPDDKRVKAALEWIKKHYTVEENPGMGQIGVYYYSHVFARTLAILELDTVQDDKGQAHDWRKELADQLMKTQQENGAWINKAERWMEGNPDLATSFALMALKYCEPATRGADARRTTGSE